MASALLQKKFHVIALTERARNPSCNGLMTRLLSLVLLFATTAPLLAQTGVPTNGFPNWEERVLHQWINRARANPTADLAGCGANCSAAELAPSCYTPMPPLSWGHNLGVAARFHGDSMARMSFFAHATPCSLRGDLASQYPGSCDGSAACACAGSGSTSSAARVSLFGGSMSGEILAAGYANPDAAFYGWLWEAAPSAPCGYGGGNGHRYLILKSSTPSVGAGYATGGSWGRYYSADFGGGTPASKLASGAHYPKQASTVAFWASWYDAAPPSSASVVVDGVANVMLLGRGTATNGAWTASVSGLGSGCRRYYFEFRDSGGATVRYPSSGTYGVGDATCADWQASSGGSAAPGLDVDGNGTKEALTDGVLVLRYLFGFRGTTLTQGAIGAGATRASATQLEAHVSSLLPQLDVDGNGTAEALTDGLLVLRYLFGFRGTTLTQGAIGAGATRATAAAIESYIGGL